MSITVEFKGGPTERTDLIKALADYCTCTYDMAGLRTHTCAGHVAMVNDQRFLDGLLFMRSQYMVLDVEEWTWRGSGGTPTC